MKLLHVIASMDPQMGGVCQAVRTIISGSLKTEVYNEVVSLDTPGISFQKEDLFPIHALGPGKSPWSYSPKLIPWLVQNLSRFDVVILHGLWLYNGFALNKAMQIVKRHKSFECIPKIFVMPHGMLDPYFQNASSRKIKALRNWVYWKLIEGNIVNQADGVLFTCEAELELARMPFKPYHPKKELNVGLGVTQPPAYNPSMRNAFLEICPELQDKSYILFISRIHEKKGVDILIKAYAAVAKDKARLNSIVDTYPNNLSQKLPKLVIAGPGLNTPYGIQLQQLASEYKELAGCIIFPGMLTGDTKWGAFYNCEAFVLPSHQENFGIAVVEALACGKPVLISNQVNIWKEISFANGGLVADDTLEGTQQLLVSWLNLTNEMKKNLVDEH